ncbi:H(+)-transporting V1 sector ATPase subunit F [Dimargaris verticillata]|uniref:V-type proton ATPase subunit F n=1 Tax=Dimargaris verticillata TaxID=2761393 RepID=A0A9W8B1P6_9FUNG|nr:H(+)-transporting V1 sector ATPase subunit F [Dimargaris verticillata]
MAALQQDRRFIAVIGDEDSVTGFLLSGIGHIDQRQKANFLIVDAKTPLTTVEERFTDFTKRKDIAIILITQQIAEEIRHLLDDHNAAFPTVLEIPSKDQPYDPSKDSVLKRVQRLFGE